MPTLPDILGSIAGFCTTIAFVPQVLKVWRSRSARDISLGMYLLFTFGLVCWLVYGLMVMSWPIIIANVVTLFLAALILIMKLRWG